jgi:hypothetical protein
MAKCCNRRQVDGRLSRHDGVILIMMNWSRSGMRKFFYG